MSSISVIKEAFVHTFNILPGGKIKIPSGQNQIAGESMYPAHSSSVLIPNTSVASSSNIVIMPKIIIQSPLVVTEIKENIGFVVRTATPPTEDIPFKWLSINTYEVGSPFSSPIIESMQKNFESAPSSTPIPTNTLEPSPLLSNELLPSESTTPSPTSEASPMQTPEPTISEPPPLLKAPSAPPDSPVEAPIQTVPEPSPKSSL